MKKIILLFSVIGFCYTVLSQNEFYVNSIVGSSGNGSASSPCKTIQAAVNTAANGNIIKVVKGTYSEAIQISQKKVQLLGEFTSSGNFGSANLQTNVMIINGTSAAPCIFENPQANYGCNYGFKNWCNFNNKRSISGNQLIGNS